MVTVMEKTRISRGSIFSDINEINITGIFLKFCFKVGFPKVMLQGWAVREMNQRLETGYLWVSSCLELLPGQGLCIICITNSSPEGADSAVAD